MASSAVPNAAVRMVWGGGLSAESLGLDAAADKHDVSLQKQNLGELYAGKLVIGAGSFGEAIDAVHVASGTPVVLKVVKRRADRVGEDYVRRCVTHDNIFAILIQLSAPARAHVNVVRYVDFLACPSHMCVVMEPLNGPELFDWLEVEWRWVGDDTLRLMMRQMLAAIEFTHASGLIHRDIKIDAFRFRTNDPASPLVLFDYGLCCLSAPPRGQPRDVVGTPEYIAPEMGTGVYDDKVDVWSVAVCFYGMVTASFVFDVAADRSGLRLVKRAEVEAALKQPALEAAPPSAVACVKKLLVFDARLRPTSAEALALVGDDDAWRASAPSAEPAQLKQGAHAILLHKSKMSTVMNVSHPERPSDADDAIPVLEEEDDEAAPTSTFGESVAQVRCILGAFIIMMAVGGITYTNGLMLIEIMDHYDVSAGTASSVQATLEAMYGLGTLFAGLLLRKRGATATLLLGVASLFLSLIGSAAAPAWYYVWITHGFGAGTAVSLVFVVGTAVPQEMFAKTNHLGLIAALVSIGIPAGFSVAVPLLKHSFREHGWSRTWQYFAVAEAGCILVGALFATPFLCPRERARPGADAATAATAAEPVTASEVARDPVFQGVALCFTLYFMGAFVPFDFGPTLAADCGVSAASLSLCLSTGSLVGRPLLGAGADKFGAAPVTAFAMVVGGLSLGFMPVVAKITSASMQFPLLAMCFVYGSTHGGRGGLMPSLITRLFSVESMPVVYGLVCVCTSAGSAVGSLAVGFLFQTFNNFYVSFAFVGTMLFIAPLFLYRAQYRAKTDGDAEIGLDLQESLLPDDRARAPFGPAASRLRSTMLQKRKTWVQGEPALPPMARRLSMG